LFRDREIVATYGGILRHGGIPRSTAFSTEPGILAFYFETLGLIAAWSIWRRQWGWGVKALLLSIIFAGWVASFSAASVAGLLAGISVVALIALYRTRSLMARSAVIFVLPLMLWGVYEAPQYLGNTYLDPIISKINLEGSSARGRLSRWVKGMNEVFQNPIVGVGPGTASSKGEVSNISWYLFLSVESGMFSIIIVISFLFTKFIRLVRSNLQGKYVFITSFVAGSVHLAVISTFFHPFLWTTIVIIDVIINRINNKSVHVRRIS
jgi:O-antigen ligase